MAISLTWPNTEAQWLSFLKLSGLRPEVAVRALWLAWLTKTYLGVDLAISSAYRSPEHNKALQKQWDQGKRAGLKTRPADKSLHMERRAFDVDPVGPEPSPETWQAIGALGEALGLRWGGRFQTPDPIHFDL